METRLLIAGEQVAGEGPGLDVENPYAQTTLATVALPSAEQVHAAVGAARAAARGWADTPAVERCELLHEVAARLRDGAIALANSTRFGLGANVYTRDLETVVRCMREIKAGTVWFNDPLTDNDTGPFGGYKQSDLGRELGQEGLEAFQETKHGHIETKIAAKSWWYPYGTTA
ncbi:MAG TPA: aldehyde dehydrogenase family protein [Solirubrobacteraceae bacterium]